MDKLQRFKVALTDPRWLDLSCEEKLFGDIADLYRFDCRSEEEVIENCADADALIVRYSPVTKRVIESLRKCRVISVYAIGVDMVDVKAATDAGIAVTNVPDYCVEEVCDHAMALLLAAARNIVVYHRSVVDDEQWDCRVVSPPRRLRGRTLGLIGFGKIPRAVSVRAMSFGLRVMAYDPYVSRAACESAGVVKAELDELLPQADFVSVHAPLTPETKGIINLERFRMMKPDAVILNASRGPIIDESAMIKALDEGWIAGAALDVLEIEPPARDNPLMHMKNVIVTPHAGFFSEESVTELRTTADLEARKVLIGERPSHLVNPAVWRD